MRRCCLFCWVVSVLLIAALSAQAQQVVRFGRHSVVPEQNVRGLRGVSGSLESGVVQVQPVGGRMNVLIQFAGNPDAQMLRRMAAADVGLEGYVGGNAYFATVRAGSRPSDFREFGALSVVPLRPEWKMAAQLEDGNIPAWAQRGEGRVAVTLVWFSNVNRDYVGALCQKRGWELQGGQGELRTARVVLPLGEVKSLAGEPWVQYIGLVDPPMRALNYNGAALSGVRPAVAEPAQGGRGLSGKGVRIGLWDANVEPHVDYGDRVHVLEFEIPLENSGGHGMHTTGTVAGAGLLEPSARGIAPAAEVYTMNFNVQRNGLTPQEEMEKVRKEYGIELTSNSYGVRLADVCDRYEELSYSWVPVSMELDQLSCLYPDLTHVFSAGNSQGECGKAYGHIPDRAKNVIYVAAVDEIGNISDFSSFGPLDDGRLAPLVAAKGVGVLSTVNGNRYVSMDGTSMACPVVSGMSALLIERYHQMHGGARPTSALIKGLLANTADDRGNAGPDYQYGYGVVNLERALQALERGWYVQGSMKRGQQDAVVKLDAPKGAKRLRAMLTWIDPTVVKEYAYGERALQNDLDLTVSQGGREVLPWILNKEQPSDAAVRGVDTLNNVEQVTLDDLQEGEVELRVSGQAKLRSLEEQSYVLTWYFETETPQFLHPVGGERFGVGDAILVRADHLQGACTVDISYDDGKNYVTVGRFDELFSQRVQIPDDAKATSHARLRVVDSKGNVLVTPGSFSIAPVVEGVAYTANQCDVNSWKLVWNKAEGAQRYVVLRADAQRGTWSEIARIVDDTTYSVKESEITEGGRNIYAIAVELGDGSYGQRSRGVLVEEPTKLALAGDKLPFVERFVDVPSRYAKMVEGENMAHDFPETIPVFNRELGAHSLLVSVKEDADVGAELFESAANTFGVRHCAVDLTGIPHGERIVFYALDWMIPAKKASDAQLRLQVDGKTVANVTGDMSYYAIDNVQEMLWDLSAYAGRTVNVELQFACNSKGGRLFVFEYGIRKVTSEPEVGVYLLNNIQARPNMGGEELEVGVYSTSLTTAAKVPIAVRVDKEQVATQLVESLQPFEVRMVKIPVDFSTKEPRGHKFSVEVEAMLPGDINQENDASSTEVYNMGDLVVFPPVTVMQIFGSSIPIDPKMVEVVRGEVRFADDGGLLEGYAPNHMSSIRFVPSDPRKVLMLTFKEIEVLHNDVLEVYTQDVPNFDYEQVKPAYSYTSGSGPAPTVFVSSAQDGSITLRFVSIDFVESGKGWEAVLREIEPGNTLTLQPLELKEQYPSGEMYLKLKVRNNTPTTQYGVRGSVKLEGTKGDIRFEMPDVPANEQIEYTLPTPVPVPYPTCAVLTVTVDGADGDVSDNTQRALIQNDKYWVGGAIKNPNRQGIVSVSIPPQTIWLEACGAHQSYALGEKLELYMGTATPLFVGLLEEPTDSMLPASLHVWIDLDPTDQAFADGGFEHYSVPLEVGKKKYRLEVDLRGVLGLRAGEYRMRIGVFNDADLDKFKQRESVDWGRSVDILAELHAGIDPVSTDVALVGIEKIASGSQLPANQTVCVHICNNGYSTLDGADLELLVNGKSLAKERCASVLEPFGGESTYTFKQTVDLSAPGQYDITVRLASDMVHANDTATVRVVNVLPQRKDKLYLLSFAGEKKEGIALPSLKITSSETSLEGWFYLNRSQQKTLFGADNILVFSTYRKSDGLPVNGIAVAIGDKMISFSDPEVLSPGEFHHVAVTLQKIELEYNDRTIVKVFIDGQDVPMYSFGVGAPSYENLVVGESLDGKVKMVRFWEKLLTRDDVRSNMEKSLRDAAGQLPEGCVAEFIMNEGTGGYIASGADVAALRGDRPNFPEAAWLESKQLFKELELEGQLFVQSVTGDRIVLLMPHDFDTHVGVKGIVKTVWPGTEVRYNEAVVNANTEFNFGNADNTIHLQLSKQLFGITTSQDVTVKVLIDKSPEAKIDQLKVLAADNANLKSDITEQTPLQTIVLGLEEATPGVAVNLEKVIVTFSRLSQGAKVVYGEKEVTEGGKLELNLSQPAAVKVVAENERDFSYYTLQVVKKQRITWGPEELVYTFTNATFPMDAASTSGSAVVYRSGNPNVAMVDGEGKLHTAGVGSTILEAMAPASGCYAAAEKVSRKVTVKRAPLTIKPRAMEIEEGSSVPDVVLEYDGLLFNEMPSSFRQPKYAVYLNASTPWTPAMVPLQAGTYSLKVSEGPTSYEDGNYMVTLQEGTLLVKPSTKVQSVSFSVKDGAGERVQNAAVLVNGASLTTDGSGSASIRLLPGEYPYTVTKANYQLAQGTVELENKDVSEAVTLRKLEVTLTYLVSGEGEIFGAKEQHLPKNGSGTPVTALPAAGYRFAGWSDSRLEATRTDSDVTEDRSITAKFEAIQHQLRYSVSEGGEFVGNPAAAQQQVAHGGDGVAVEVHPKAGWVFYGWSDGVRELKRTDTKVEEDLAVVATFYQPFNLPFIENFESTSNTPLGWRIVNQSTTGGSAWGIGQNAKFMRLSNGRFAYVNSSDEGIQRHQTTYLQTPQMSVMGVEGDISLSFDMHYLNADAKVDSVCVEYSVDGGTWQELAKYNTNVENERQNLTIEAAVLRGKKLLSIRWYYGANWAFFVAIDNVAVAEAAREYSIVYEASENGKVKSETHSTPKNSLEVNVQQGVLGEAVYAVPDAGYEFDIWSDRNTDNPRRDSATARYIAYFKPKRRDFVTLSYDAGQYGKIEGVVYQKVEMGAEGSPVYAAGDTQSVKFVEWSDGRNDNPRVDEGIMGGVKVTAKFERYCLIKVDALGEGTVETSLANGAPLPADGLVSVGAKVKIVAKPKPGNAVARWEGIDASLASTVVEVVANTDILASVEFRKQVTLTVKVTSGGVPVPNASVAIAGYPLAETDPDGIARFALALGSYEYSVSKDGYATAVGKVMLATDREEDVDLLTGATAAFTVVADGQPAQQARIAIDDKEIITGTDGKISIGLEKREYEYSVAKEGYLTHGGIINLASGNVEESIALERGAVLTVKVAVKSTPCSGAKVTVDGQEGKTDSEGRVAFRLAKSSHSYTVNADGYLEEKGETDLSRGDAAIEISLRCELVLLVRQPGGSVAEGAKVMLEKQPTVEVPASGRVAYRLEPGSYSYQIEKQGFVVKKGYVVLLTNSEQAIELDRLSCTLAFSVTSKNQPVNQATIKIQGQPGALATDADGKASIVLPSGQYAYSVEKDNYKTVNGSINLTNDKTVEVELQSTETAIPKERVESVLLSNVQVLPNPFGAVLHLTGVDCLRELQVYTVQGVLLYTIAHGGGPTISLPTGHWGQGVYILRLTDVRGAAKQVRVVKQ